MLGWMKHKCNQDSGRNINTSDMQMTPPLMSESKEEIKSLDESERGEGKSSLKTQHSEN